MKSPVLWINQKFDPLRAALLRLPARDRRALLLLSGFLVLFVVGGLLWWAHDAAQKAEKNANAQRDLLLWMQAQAPNLAIEQGSQPPFAQQIQQAAAQQGLTLSQNGDDNQQQVSVSHPSFAVLGSWLSGLAANGVQIEQLDIRQQSGGILQLQATLTRNRGG